MILDAVWIGIAFLLGLAARQAKLPPLVGYLAAGFVLFSLGIDPGEVIDHFAEMGVTLLLFTIGLKLRIDSLLRPQVWGVAFLHMGIVTPLLALVLLGAAATGIPLLAGLEGKTALLLGFALSYSSTVFAVKVLEDKGEMSSIYGRTAIGILVMQDIVAVVYLASSTGKMPSMWALLLLVGLLPLRYLLMKVMDHTGHAELMILFGLSIALGGARLFDLVSIKGDLGALIFGVLLASHRKADSLSKALLGLKDLFLVGFFLSIGLKGLPGLDTLLVAMLLVVLVPAKSALFFWLLTRFRLRGRTAFLTSLSLSNYSEFGLIIAAMGVGNGLLPESWLITVAVALTLSFVLAAPLNTLAHDLYERHHERLMRFQHPKRAPDDEDIDTGDATVLIFGMGRVGTGAYEALDARSDTRVLSFDIASEVVEHHRKEGRRILQTSATDSDFWSRLRLDRSKVCLVMLALPQRAENVYATTQLLKNGYTGRISALVTYEDDAEALKEAGVHRVFNLYTEAGAGFAANACHGVIALDVPTVPHSDSLDSERIP